MRYSCRVLNKQNLLWFNTIFKLFITQSFYIFKTHYIQFRDFEDYKYFCKPDVYKIRTLTIGSYVMYYLRSCMYVESMYTEEPPSGAKTSKHRPIDVPFFSPFGSCQRSTSKGTRWNQALLLVSHWCITRPRRSHLCKHTLSKPKENVGCWPHRYFAEHLQGGKRVACWQRATL